MPLFARYTLTSPLPPAEALARLARHTVHQQFGTFPRSEPEVPKEHLYFIGRVSEGTFDLRHHDADSENTPCAVVSGVLAEGTDGTRIECRARPSPGTWMFVTFFAFWEVLLLGGAILSALTQGFDGALFAIVGGCVVVGIVPPAILMRSGREARQLRENLERVLAPASPPE